MRLVCGIMCADRTKQDKTRKRDADMAKRTKRSGTLEKRGGYWLARWMVDGKRFSRSTGCKVSGGKTAKKQAEDRLREFTHDYTLKDERLILEKQVARLEGVGKEIEQEEAKKSALRFAEGWTAYLNSQSRPRSGQGTMHNYEQQYFIFVEWLKEHHADITELRAVTPDIAAEYAQFLLTGTPKIERDAITTARKWLYRFDYRTKRDGERERSEDALKAIAKRRELAARVIRDPVRGATFNKHINALALIWRHVARHEKARITCNPWAFDENTGNGIRRITLNHAERPHSRRALTVAEVYNLLGAATGELKVLIAVGVYTGLRLGDAVLLQWANIDRVTGIITVRSRKTDTETRAAVHPFLARTIQAETNATQGYIMPELARLYLSGKSGRVKLSNMISGLFESIGINTKFQEDGRRARSDCGFHSLRHTFVTMLRANGVKLQTAKELAGHHTDRMTEHYTHEDGRAVLALPDFSEQGAKIENETDADAIREDGQARGTGATVAERPAARLTFDELKAALAGLTDAQRAELLRGV